MTERDGPTIWLKVSGVDNLAKWLKVSGLEEIMAVGKGKLDVTINTACSPLDWEMVAMTEIEEITRVLASMRTRLLTDRFTIKGASDGVLALIDSRYLVRQVNEHFLRAVLDLDIMIHELQSLPANTTHREQGEEKAG